MQAISGAIALSFLLIVLSCSRVSAAEQTNEKILVQDNSAFAMELYQKLRASDGNIFFSPYSISTALAMTYGGARGNTEKEMA
ncbi:MAG: serpin family protein, partial [Candidatus Electrothrix sp. LOE1_4_5]|nr:serpin family protein [Candidatus Electrothrix gigas]